MTVAALYKVAGNYFQHWLLDGTPQGTSTSVAVLLDGEHTLTAVYRSPILITVGGTPAVKVNLADVSGSTTSGAPPSTFEYDPNLATGKTLVITAPSQSGTRAFREWLLVGVHLSYLQTTTLTLNGSHTLSALYASLTSSSLFWAVDSAPRVLVDQPFGSTGSGENLHVQFVRANERCRNFFDDNAALSSIDRRAHERGHFDIQIRHGINSGKSATT